MRLRYIPHELVDSIGKVEYLIPQIKRAKTVSVDTEFYRKSPSSGTLGLISVGTKDRVYVFDVFSMGKDLFDAGLGNILESESYIKVFFDCREKCMLLEQEYGIVVKGILDVQLLYEIGNGRERYANRNAFISYGCHKIDQEPKIGLKRLVEKLEFPGWPEYVNFKETVNDRREKWVERPLDIERPLPKTMITYAAADARFILDALGRIWHNMTNKPELKSELMSSTNSRGGRPLIIELSTYRARRYCNINNSSCSSSSSLLQTMIEIIQSDYSS
eukprot:GHVU01134211.1.p1 GENE.GHVU01134211.1~~GHVU01134211.1.p1  ORF type:complete len:275 (+),score=9.77 GHVU01134211.1:190-1014(+)